ncbi:MAG: TetR/AcrR family transcriptional regulator [Rubrobacter sp.]
MTERRTQEERREATRGALLSAAWRLFAERGYAGASQEEIVSEAGVTRGALYHHFAGGKLGLFRAVVIAIQDEIAREIISAASKSYKEAGDLLEAYFASYTAYFEVCLRPDVKRILMQDGASVLGWDEWYEIDARYGLSQTEEGLRMLVEAGILAPQPITPLAHLMYGASLEAATYVLESGDPEAAKDEMVGLMRKMLTGFMEEG